MLRSSIWMILSTSKCRGSISFLLIIISRLLSPDSIIFAVIIVKLWCVTYIFSVPIVKMLKLIHLRPEVTLLISIASFITCSIFISLTLLQIILCPLGYITKLLKKQSNLPYGVCVLLYWLYYWYSTTTVKFIKCFTNWIKWTNYIGISLIWFTFTCTKWWITFN